MPLGNLRREAPILTARALFAGLAAAAPWLSAPAMAVNRKLRAADTHPDVIITDCHMPVMDGFQYTAASRSEEAHSARIPVLALTANALTGESDRCLAAGMDGYLSKPVELVRLREALDRVMATGTRAP